MTQIVSVPSLSFEEIRADLVAYARSYAEQGQGWQDYLDSSSATVLLDLLAGMGSYNSTHALAALRESFLFWAKKKGNVVDHAATLGYKTARVQAPQFRLNLNIRTDAFLSFREVQGSFQGQSLSLEESLQVSSGAVQLDFYLGEWKEETFVITDTRAFKRLLIQDTSVDNRENRFVRMLINDVSVSLTSNVEDIIEGEVTASRELISLDTSVNEQNNTITVDQQYLLGTAVRVSPQDSQTLMPFPLNENSIYYVVPQEDHRLIKLAPSFAAANYAIPQVIDLTSTGSGLMNIIPLPFGTTSAQEKVVVRTTSDGIQFLFGDGQIGRLLKAGDVVNVRYLSTTGSIPVRSIDPSDISLNIDAEVVSIEDIDRGSDGDSAEKIALVAPAYHGSKRRMVTKYDHAAVFLSYAGDFISTSAKKIEQEGQCCMVNLCYLYRPYPNGSARVATNLEKDNMMLFLESFRMIGTKLVISDPQAVILQPKLTVLVSEGTNIRELSQELLLTVQGFCFKLDTTFHVGAVIEALGQLDAVKRIYWHRPVSDRVLEWNQYIWLDVNYFKSNLTVVTDSAQIETVTDSTGGYL